MMVIDTFFARLKMEMPESEVALPLHLLCTYSALLGWARVVVETYYFGHVTEGCHIPAGLLHSR